MKRNTGAVNAASHRPRARPCERNTSPSSQRCEDGRSPALSFGKQRKNAIRAGNLPRCRSPQTTENRLHHRKKTQIDAIKDNIRVRRNSPFHEIPLRAPVPTLCGHCGNQPLISQKNFRYAVCRDTARTESACPSLFAGTGRRYLSRLRCRCNPALPCPD
jgi:hypothetical protein